MRRRVYRLVAGFYSNIRRSVDFRVFMKTTASFKDARGRPRAAEWEAGALFHEKRDSIDILIRHLVTAI